METAVSATQPEVLQSAGEMDALPQQAATCPEGPRGAGGDGQIANDDLGLAESPEAKRRKIDSEDEEHPPEDVNAVVPPAPPSSPVHSGALQDPVPAEEQDKNWSTLVEIDQGFPFDVVWPGLNDAVLKALRSVHATWPEMGWLNGSEMEATLQRGVEAEGAGVVARGLSKHEAERVARRLQGVVPSVVRHDPEGATAARAAAEAAAPRLRSPADDTQRRERIRQRIRALREGGMDLPFALLFPDALGQMERELENDDLWSMRATVMEHVLEVMSSGSGILDSLLCRRFRLAREQRVVTVMVSRTRLLSSALETLLRVAPEDLRPRRLRMRYQGEEGEDGEGGSGVTRAFLTQAGGLIVQASLGLLLPSVGEYLHLNPLPGFLALPPRDAESVQKKPEEWCRLLGRLLGMSVAHECPLGFLLAPPLCKQLLLVETCFEDLQFAPGMSEGGTGWFTSIRKMLAHRSSRLVPDSRSLIKMSDEEVEAALYGYEAVMPSKSQRVFTSMARCVGSAAHTSHLWEAAADVASVLVSRAVTPSQRALALSRARELLEGITSQSPKSSGALSVAVQRALAALAASVKALVGQSEDLSEVRRLLQLTLGDDTFVTDDANDAATSLFSVPSAPVTSDLTPLRPQCIPSVGTWLTAGAKVLMRTAGMFYHEVRLGDDFNDEADPQLGWLTDGFIERDYDCDGVGDDAEGWAVDGVRQKKWHNGPHNAAWPRRWSRRDVIGLAANIEAGKFQCSLNGEWVPAADMSFEPTGRSFFPALSMKGGFEMHIPRRTWKYSPPSEDYRAWADDGVFARPLPVEPSGPSLAEENTDVTLFGNDAGGKLSVSNLEVFAEAVTRQAIYEDLQPYLDIVASEFRSVIPEELQQELSFTQIQDRISGQRLDPKAFVEEWRGKTTYCDCNSEDDRVRLWWSHISGLDGQELSEVFSWCTGFAAIPSTAWKFQIKAIDGSDRCPTISTCMTDDPSAANRGVKMPTLYLPDYESREALAQRLTWAVAGASAMHLH
eukprot:TRINITY_DN43789_c0_g1_i1.p1 TRINITY_DN43789_c0_g1~~TRINITY_DN43789_c0_g1_i1.p1  ORF type:complete len:1011 (+),score=185.36 TRINITY_DN43789_c0_g1_i1:141-3173(+)